jgi:hypothetical protein
MSCLDHSFDGSDDLIELGHRNQAAAAEGLERRRADLGKQQGLSLRENDVGRTYHHRRRKTATKLSSPTRAIA